MWLTLKINKPNAYIIIIIIIKLIIDYTFITKKLTR